MLAALFAPTLATWYGWNNVLGQAMIPLALTLVAYMLLAAGLAIVALAGLTAVKKRWRTTWGAAHLTMAKV